MASTPRLVFSRQPDLHGGAADAARRELIIANLPRSCFDPCPDDAGFIALYALVFIAAETALVFTTPIAPLLSLAAGTALGLLMFRAHDLTHGTILRGRMKYPAELVAWGFNAFSPTLWRILHNKWHHQYTNTPEDPDRMFTMEERKSLTRRIYAFLFVPLEGSGAPRHPLMAFLFYVYTIKFTIAALINRPLILNPSTPDFSRRERLAIAGELLFITAVYGIFIAASISAGHSGLYAAMWQAFVPLTIASLIVMAFIFTQHIGNPLHDVTDILSTTTSIRVPKSIDALSSNFGYHVEHHLFPAMNPRHYPFIAAQLKAMWPDQYRSLPFIAAWKRVLKAPVFRPLVPAAKPTVTPVPAREADTALAG